MASFKWNPKKDEAALLFARGFTLQEAADEIGVSTRTLTRWRAVDEFSIEVDRLTFMVGVAARAERLRIANRVIKARTENSQYPITKADLLDWLKFAQSETDGIKLDFAAFLPDAAQVARSEPARTD